METLAPRSLYDDDELRITSRLPLLSGVFFGSFTALFELVEELVDGASFPAALLIAIPMGLFSGLLFGATFPWLLRRSARRVNDRAYNGDPRLIPPPPDGYLYRLPCGWLARPNLVVGGVLYLGPAGLRFDPHLRNLRRYRESVIMEPLQDVHLDMVERPLPRIAWMWGRRSLPRIRVRWPAGEALFGIPGAPGVLATLQDRIAVLKQNPVSTG